MKKIFLFSAVLLFVLGLFFVQDGFAVMYKYVDKDGNIGMANDLQAVPEQYRATATVVKQDDEETASAQAAPSPGGKRETAVGAPVHVPASTPAAIPAQAQEKSAAAPFSARLLISLAVVISFIFLSVILGKLSSFRGHGQALSVVRIALAWVVVLYIVFAHAKDVMTLFSMAGHKIDDVSQESAKKGEKAAKAIKALDAMLEQAQQQAQQGEQAVKQMEQEAEK